MTSGMRAKVPGPRTLACHVLPIAMDSYALLGAAVRATVVLAPRLCRQLAQCVAAKVEKLRPGQGG